MSTILGHPFPGWRDVYGADFSAGGTACQRGESIRRSPKGMRGHYWRWGWRCAALKQRDDAMDVRLLAIARRHAAALEGAAQDLMVWLHPRTGAINVNPCRDNVTGNGFVCFGTVAEVRERLAERYAGAPA